MELSYDAKTELLARLAARQPRPYDPAHDITIDDVMASLEKPSRNVAMRLLGEAIRAGELREGVAIRNCKRIKVYRTQE